LLTIGLAGRDESQKWCSAEGCEEAVEGVLGAVAEFVAGAGDGPGAFKALPGDVVFLEKGGGTGVAAFEGFPGVVAEAGHVVGGEGVAGPDVEGLKAAVRGIIEGAADGLGDIFTAEAVAEEVWPGLGAAEKVTGAQGDDAYPVVGGLVTADVLADDFAEGVVIGGGALEGPVLVEKAGAIGIDGD